MAGASVTQVSVSASLPPRVRHILWARRGASGGADMDPSRLWALMAIGLGVAGPRPAADAPFDVASFERPRVLAAAARSLDEEPRTVPPPRSPRSPGGPPHFLSQGQYLL